MVGIPYHRIVAFCTNSTKKNCKKCRFFFLKLAGQWAMIGIIKKRKERDRLMCENRIAFDLDDLIYGNATLVPSER
jgi:hypothetical protein